MARIIAFHLEIRQRGVAAIESREAFGVRRIPALSGRPQSRTDQKAPEYGALQTLRDSLYCEATAP